MMRLEDDDGQAVDLLLDKASATATVPATLYVAPAKSDFDQRMRSVASILKLLQQMPAHDPPPDLVDRTVQLINEHAFRDPVPPVQPGVDPESRHSA